MTPQEFYRLKPDALRLGQFFYNCYFYKLGWNTTLHRDTQELYNTNNPTRAKALIAQIMLDYQWFELPPIEFIDGHWRCK